MQHPEESNFHVFYILLQQLPNDLKSKLHLNAVSSFEYLNGSEETQRLKSQTFHTLDTALRSFGYSAELKNLIYAWLAAILHLGEIQFKYDENGYASDILESFEIFLNYATSLLNIDAGQLKNAFLLHQMSSSKEV